MSKKQKRHFDLIILISIVFAIYGIVQSFLINHQDAYIVVFAWISFSLVWATIAMIRYNYLRGRI